MLKVLYLPLNDTESAQNATVNAFISAGVNLKTYDFNVRFMNVKNKDIVNNEFISEAINFKPDFIHMQAQFTDIITPYAVDKIRAALPNVVVSNWTGDVRSQPNPYFVNLSKALNYSFISSVGQIDLYKNAGGKNIEYWQIGYDPKVHFPMNKKTFKYDISFTANNYGHMFPDSKIRYNAAMKIQERCGNRFGLFGAGWPVRTHRLSSVDTNTAYNDSICTLSISHYNNVSHYFSDRLLHCLASGRPTICWNFPDYNSYFVNGEDIFIANNYNDIFDILDFCKKNPEAATKIGQNAAMKALSEHSFRSKILELIKRVGFGDKL